MGSFTSFVLSPLNITLVKLSFTIDRVKHVQAAVDAFAVETLLISDALFRSRDLSERKKFVDIVDSVKENMGTVRIFSSLHVSGERKVYITLLNHSLILFLLLLLLLFIRIEPAIGHRCRPAFPHTRARR